MPQELTYLLKCTLSSVEQINKIVIERINRNPALVKLLEELFSEYDTSKRLSFVLRKNNWNQFRAQFSSIYIYRLVFGNFPDKTQLSLVNDIHKFEDKLLEFSVRSNSRGFLLGLYLQMSQIQMRKENEDTSINLLNIPKEVYRIIDLSPAKSEKIDLLIMLVWHLNEYIGYDHVSSLVKSKSSYKEMYELLNNDQKKDLMNNYISYCCSINENEVFINDRV